MRELIKPQLQLDQQDIGAVRIDGLSRGYILRLMRSLQLVYAATELRERVFSILGDVLAQRADREGRLSATTGCLGTTQWSIPVLGTLRLGLNTDYEPTTDLANLRRMVRPMLGCSDWSDKTLRTLQALEDSLRLFIRAVLSSRADRGQSPPRVLE
jgi:hypothetical protein